MVRMRKPLRAYSQAQSEENTLPNRQETQGDRHRAWIAAVLQNLLTLLPWLKINPSRVPAFQITAIEGFAGGSSGIAPASRRRDLFRARLKSREESCAGSVAPRGKNTPLSLPRGAPWCSFHILGREHNGPYLDRKSTRLNSSHLVISYAVFCLKKKKNTLAICLRRIVSHICPHVYS